MDFVLGFDGGNAQDIACYGYVIWGEVQVNHEQHIERPWLVMGEGQGKCHDKLQTNNVAEWSALMYGLMAVLPHIVTAKNEGVEVKRLYLHGDSQLVLRQLTGEYSVTKPHLKFYHGKCKAIVDRIEQEGVEVITDWEPRDHNEGPDSLTHKARQRFLESCEEMG